MDLRGCPSCLGPKSPWSSRVHLWGAPILPPAPGGPHQELTLKMPVLLALACSRCPQAQAGKSPGGRTVYHLLSTYCVLVVALIPDQLSSGTDQGVEPGLPEPLATQWPSFTGSRVPSHCLSFPPSPTGCHLGPDMSFRVPEVGGWGQPSLYSPIANKPVQGPGAASYL